MHTTYICKEHYSIDMNTITKTTISEQLEKFIQKISDEERKYMMRYDESCLTDAVRIIQRMESIREKIYQRKMKEAHSELDN